MSEMDERSVYELISEVRKLRVTCEANEYDMRCEAGQQLFNELVKLEADYQGVNIRLHASDMLKLKPYGLDSRVWKRAVDAFAGGYTDSDHYSDK